MLIEDTILHSTIFSCNEKKRFQKIIKEELAINSQVTDETEKIYHQFLGAIKEKKFSSIFKGDNYTLRTIEIIAKVFKKDVIFTFLCYNVLDKKKYQEISGEFGFGNGFLTGKDRIEIVVGFLSGSLNTNVKSILQHELGHLFQIRKNKVLNTYGLGQKGKDAYQMAFQLLKNESINPFIFNVAYVIYTQSESETDAFANQLYQELNSSIGEKDIVIKNSNAFLNYKNGKQCINKIAKNRDLYEPIVESFGFTYDKFLKIFKKLNNRAILKIGKVITKYDKENQPTEVLLNNLNKTFKK